METDYTALNNHARNRMALNFPNVPFSEVGFGTQQWMMVGYGVSLAVFSLQGDTYEINLYINNACIRRCDCTPDMLDYELRLFKLFITGLTAQFMRFV